MQYYFIGNDGQRYGPADEATFNQWIAEGRVGRDSMVERVDDGTQLRASMVPGFIFPTAGPESPRPPTTPTGDPYAGVPRPNAYGSDVGPGGSPYTSYPRMGGYTGTGVPPELQGGWNWGAFYFSWIWGLNHRAYITLAVLGIGLLQGLLSVAMRPAAGADPAAAFTGTGLFGNLISLVTLGLVIWFGVKGNTWAWESGRFASVEECKKCQKIWAWWALGFFLFSCVCGIILFFFVFAAMGAAMSGAAGPGPRPL